MKKILSISLLLSVFFLSACKSEKKQEVLKKLDAKSLMDESSKRFIDFWGSSDANGLAGEFTSDASRVISNSEGALEGTQAILNSFTATFSEDSEFKNTTIETTTIETRFVSEDIILGVGTFKIIDKDSTIVESGKWGNVYKYVNGKIKFLLESAHASVDAADISVKEIVSLENSIISEEMHFEKIQTSVSSYIKYLNEKDATSLSMLFAENGIQSVDSKEGVVIGREKIGTSQMFSEGQVLNANILGYKYLGNSLAIAFGNWTQTDSESNTMTTGQWGNLFQIEGDIALLLMESAGRNK